MKKTYKFSGMQDGTYSQYETENYTGFKVAMVALAAAVIALVVFFVNYL